ncbi:hypothetical protein Q3G72_027165 [Acer saccharum]|nr:hypothetical protein Q3G72_027165 [Acer saccharum]
MLLRYERLMVYCFRCDKLGHVMDECTMEVEVEVEEEREVSSATSRKLAVWLRASSPPKRSFRGSARQESVSKVDVNGGHNVLVVPHNREKEMSSPFAQRDVCMEDEIVADISLERQGHEGEEMSATLIVLGTFISSARDEGRIKPNDFLNEKVLDELIAPVVGLNEANSFGLFSNLREIKLSWTTFEQKRASEELKKEAVHDVQRHHQCHHQRRRGRDVSLVMRLTLAPFNCA